MPLFGTTLPFSLSQQQILVPCKLLPFAFHCFIPLQVVEMKWRVYYLWYLTLSCWSDNGGLAVQYLPFPTWETERPAVNHNASLQPTASLLNVWNTISGNWNTTTEVGKKKKKSTLQLRSSPQLLTMHLGPNHFRHHYPRVSYQIILKRCPKVSVVRTNEIVFAEWLLSYDRDVLWEKILFFFWWNPTLIIHLVFYLFKWWTHTVSGFEG